MARDFTPEEELEIVDSPEFEKFLAERRKAGSDRIGIEDFLDEGENRNKWLNRFDGAHAHNNSNTQLDTVSVPDLSRLDETGLTGLTTAELVAMLRDPNYAGGNNEQFRQEVADLFEKYHNGKTANEAEFKAKMKELQARHSLAENEAIENFVSPRTARDLPKISLKLVPGADENVTHLEDREIPDLSQLVLHMRNNSMSASILQERLDDLRANHPDDKRAIEIYEAVVNAYRAGNQEEIGKLNDMIKDEKDVLVAEDIAREVEYDNAYDVPRIKKQIVVPGPAPKPENVTHLEDREIPDLSQLVLHMRNNSMTASILQERLDDLRANHPDDKRAIEIYEAVINAYHTGNQEEIGKLNDMIKDEKDVLVAEDIAREVEYDNAYDVPRIKKQIVVPGPGPRPGPDPRPEPKPVIVDGVVMRGWNADEWQQLIDGQNTEFLNAIEFMEGVEITALKAINKLPDNFSDMTPDERRAVIEALSPVEMARFNGAMNTASQKILETYPPKFMVFLHQKIAEDLKTEEAKKDKDANIVSMLTEQRNQLNQAMINKLEGYVKGTIVVDQTSIADVYDGASEMFAYLKEQNKDSNLINQMVGEAQKKLDTEIKIYDEANGFDKVGPNDGPAIEQAFDKTSKMADEIKLENYPEIQPMIDGLEFESEEEKKIFLDIVKEQAARAAAVKGFKDKDEDLKAKFAEAFQEAATVNVGALLMTNELLKFEGQAEPKDIDPKALEANVARALEDLKSGKKVKISKNAAMAHAANAVNGVAGWLNRLATRKNDKGETVGIGTRAPVLKKMYDKIQHIDKTCIKRFGPAYEAVRSYGKAVSQNMISQGINQIARYGINAGCMLLGQPGLGAPLYATFYAGQAIWRLRKQYNLEKEALAKEGKKMKFWGFMGRHAPELAQTALITSATLIGGVWGGKAVEALGHALPLDRCLSYAGMAVGGVTSMVKGYRASRKEGNSVWKSLGKSLGNTTLSTATAFGCGWGIGAGINAMDTGLHSAGLLGETMTKDITTDDYNQHADDTVHYHKEPVMSAEDTARYAEMTPEQLNEAGIAVDAIGQEAAQELVSKTDAELAEQGIVRSETTADDPNGVKVIDVPEHTAITYPDNFTEHAKEIVSTWTKDDPGLLNDNVAALKGVIDSTKASLMAQGIDRQIDPYRILMIAGDCGAQMVNADIDTNVNHVDLQEKYDCNLSQNTLAHMQANGEDMEACHGKHTVLGSKWCLEHGVSEEAIKAVAGITDADGKIIPEKLTPDVIKTILALDQSTTLHNEVGYVTDAPIHSDGVLDRNAEEIDGKYQHAEAGRGTLYTTYANGQGMNSQTIEEKAHFERFDQLSHVEMQQEMPMTTTFDRYWSKIKSCCLLGRTGANGKTKEVENDKRPVRMDNKTNNPAQAAMRNRAAEGAAK